MTRSYPAAQGENQPLGRTPFHHKARWHTCSLTEWDQLDTPIHITYTCVGCGTQLKLPGENSHRQGENVPSLHCGPSWESVLFLHQLMKWHWTKQCFLRTCYNLYIFPNHLSLKLYLGTIFYISSYNLQNTVEILYFLFYETGAFVGRISDSSKFSDLKRVLISFHLANIQPLERDRESDWHCGTSSAMLEKVLILFSVERTLRGLKGAKSVILMCIYSNPPTHTLSAVWLSKLSVTCSFSYPRSTWVQNY